MFANQRTTLSRVKIICSDKYEVTKLESIVLGQNRNQIFVRDILNVYDNEVIVYLQDKSAHSITLQDDIQAEKFVDFMQSILETRHKIINAATTGNTIEITKENY